MDNSVYRRIVWIHEKWRIMLAAQVKSNTLSAWLSLAMGFSIHFTALHLDTVSRLVDGSLSFGTKSIGFSNALMPIIYFILSMF